MSKPLALIVDDEPDIRELLKLTLGRMDVDTVAAEDLEGARKSVRQKQFDLCLTDMQLPDGNGIDLIRYMQKHCPNVPVAMITAYGSMEYAIEALKAGAFDFVSKPVDLQVLRNLVTTALKLGKRRGGSNRKLIGESGAMETTRLMISKLARSQAPVYVSGESGTGKELVARMIHEEGPRADGPFVPVNCGAIPTELMESEFFGHRKGSFTGAVSDKQGLFQAADGGTLFLDEVADLPLAMQVKLLRAIQEKAVRPVGEEKEVAVDVRILSATHKALGDLVKEGQFRQDLYYRINVIELPVPPLRERNEDIPLLADYLLDRLSSEASTERAALSDGAVAALQSYDFPGNVRELENVLERATTLCIDSVIEVADLGLSKANDQTVRAMELEGDLDSFLVSVEKETILKTLGECNGNKTAAAKKLGLTFGAFRYRLQKLGLE